MSTETLYPLSIRDVPPHPDALRLTVRQPISGRPDGCHTGGAWLWEERVYKPLDGRPFANCEYHVSTYEAECLDALADKPFFPRNWAVEERNGRRFLVRAAARIVRPDELSFTELVSLEGSVREANEMGWEIGEEITIAEDPHRQFFIVDLSAAHRVSFQGRADANDLQRLTDYATQAGAAGAMLLAIRSRAALALERMDEYERYSQRFEYVYASFHRRVYCFPDSIPHALVQSDIFAADFREGIPWTWIVTNQRLDQSLVDLRALTLARWPLEHKPLSPVA
jgi:hypothetical protein